MKEPKRIPLTNNPRNKEPQKLPLTTLKHYDIDMTDDVWIKIKNEDNKQNDQTSIQQLESDKID